MPDLPSIFSGCKIFPCVPGDKHPLTSRGWLEASSDPGQIAAWEQEYPDCNWALATGLSGLFVIDVDPEGIATWERMQDESPELRAAVESAYTVQTPRGGWHIYFRGEGPSTASRIAEGIDTRGGIKAEDGRIKSGGYVLLPGSRTGAGVYVPVGQGSLGSLPPVVSAIVPERKRAETHGLETEIGKDQERNVQWATDLLKAAVQSGDVSVMGRGGNNKAFQIACRVLDKAISPALCYDLLWEHWNPHCQPPWDDWELERVVRNAAAYGEDTGGGVKGFQANTDAFAGCLAANPDAGEAVSGQPRTKLKWLHDFADGVEDPAWLIPGILPSQGTAMVYGPSGTYKSFITLDMALCLAFGHAGQWGAPPVKNDVLILSGEGPIATARKRWPAWMEWQAIEDRENHRLVFHNRVPYYHDTEAWEGIKADLTEMNVNPSLILIDTLSRLLTGLDENDSKDSTMIVGFLEDLARYFECLVLVVHHTGKDLKRGARGSSVWEANIDTIMTTRKVSAGASMKMMKLKDADVPDTPQYFEKKDVGDSIVLEKVDALPEEPKSGGARRDWASESEVAGVLHANGGVMGFEILAQTIAAKHMIDLDKVKKALGGKSGSAELRWMVRDSDGKWALPSKEFDL